MSELDDCKVRYMNLYDKNNELCAEAEKLCEAFEIWRENKKGGMTTFDMCNVFDEFREKYPKEI